MGKRGLTLAAAFMLLAPGSFAGYAEEKETIRWQQAVDVCARAGGGAVRVPSGRHLVGTIYLKSNVTLVLERGCTLVGSLDIADYPDIRLGYAEIREPWQALIAAEGQTNVAVVGEGTIDGNGAAFPRDTRLGRPRGLLFHGCAGVRVEGVTLRDLASWTCYFKECDGVVMRKAVVDSHVNANNDGVDIEARNVLVEDCTFDCDDDGIVLKSDNPDFLVENVRVRRCEVRSCCTLFKLGTASHGGFRDVLFEDCTGGASLREWKDPKTGKGELSRYRVACWPGATYDPSPIGGIAVECVDGGAVENVTFRNIEIREANTPIFIRAGLRLNRSSRGVSLGIPFGTGLRLGNVLIENVRAKATSFTASSITGVHQLRVSDVTLRNVAIEVPGAGEAGRRELGVPVPEKEGAHPESNMFAHRMLPAYGFYVRHADNVCFDNVVVNVRNSEVRPEILLDDVGVCK